MEDGSVAWDFSPWTQRSSARKFRGKKILRSILSVSGRRPRTSEGRGPPSPQQVDRSQDHLFPQLRLQADDKGMEERRHHAFTCHRFQMFTSYCEASKRTT